VDDRDCQVPFKLTAKLDKLTLKLDRPKLTAADEKRPMEKGCRKELRRPL